jgi:hypothetical protein
LSACPWPIRCQKMLLCWRLLFCLVCISIQITRLISSPNFPGEAAPQGVEQFDNQDVMIGRCRSGRSGHRQTALRLHAPSVGGRTHKGESESSGICSRRSLVRNPSRLIPKTSAARVRFPPVCCSTKKTNCFSIACSDMGTTAVAGDETTD